MSRRLDKWTACVAGLVVLLGASAFAGEGTSEPTKRVLILDSFGRDFPVWDSVPPTLKQELAKRLSCPIEFHEAELETAWTEQTVAEKAFAGYLRTLYGQDQPDLVVPVGAPAAQFWCRNRANLFPETPILVGGIDEKLLPTLSLCSRDTAALARLDLAACIQLMWQLFPSTTNLVIILGNSPHEKLWVAECKQALGPYTNRLHFTWLNDLPFPEMCRRLANLPPRTAIGYGSILMDAGGTRYEHMEALERVCAVANAPVLGTEEEELGHGIVGGSLISGKDLGLETARMAARLLRGEAPSTIPRPLVRAGPPTFDWRQLERWHVSAKRLPPGSVVRYWEPSLWQRYHWYVLGALGIIMVQAATIFGMMIQRARRRQAEASAYELSGRLISVQENERRDIAGKLHDGLGQDLLVIASQAQLSLSQPENPPGTVRRLNEIALTAKQAIQQARQMAHNLRPGLLDELGLTKAIRAMAEKTGQAAGLAVEVALDEEADGLLPSEFEVNLFRVVQESLNNILKHAKASRVKITLTKERSRLRLMVSDNGHGFDPGHVPPQQRGLGLGEIAERGKMMKGRVAIESRPGQGTKVILEVPIGP